MVLLFADEVTACGWYRYYEWAGGAPDLVEVAGEPPRTVRFVDGRQAVLQSTTGFFEGPVDALLTRPVPRPGLSARI